ncbi:GNAT family N-acetyltransferase [Paraburkholderia dilworthii]|uniref:GNAT family N-acetyltransferase n=1 Tax=Paraburkholderia dilworthii TaxID=948106 RepID=A0ABW9DIV4_9BURK
MNTTPLSGSSAGAIGLRPMVEGVVDRRALFALYKVSLHEHIDQTFGWDENFQQDRFNQSYRDPEFIAVTLGSADVGYVALKDDVGEVHLSLLLLQPEYRSRGIGREVMRTLMSDASRSSRPLMLSCFLCNQGAMRFYEGLGFRAVETDEHFITYRFCAFG